jgi:hypothetical protein
MNLSSQLQEIDKLSDTIKDDEERRKIQIEILHVALDIDNLLKKEDEISMHLELIKNSIMRLLEQ